MADERQKRWTVETWIQAASLIAAVAAIVVTVYFSFRSERAKEVSISVVTKRPLLSLDTSSSRSGIEIKLKGANVAAPWLVAVHIENTGGLPIEDKDIESPLRLFFEGAKPISSEVQSRSDASINASTTLGDDSITVGHKLLNPGDWINIDILFEGEPKIPPLALARISGVSTPKVVVAKQGEDAKIKVTWPALPVPLVYLVLVIASVSSLVLFLAASFGAYQYFEGRVNRTIRSGDTKLPYQLESAAMRFELATNPARIVFAAIRDGSSPIDFIDDEMKLRTALDGLPRGFLESLSLDVEGASKLVTVELRKGLQSSLADSLRMHLPSGKDRKAQEAMEALTIDGLTSAQVIERANELFKDGGGGSGSSGPDDFGLAVAIILLALSVGVLAGGAWRTMLLQ